MINLLQKLYRAPELTFPSHLLPSQKYKGNTRHLLTTECRYTKEEKMLPYLASPSS